MARPAIGGFDTQNTPFSRIFFGVSQEPPMVPVPTHCTVTRFGFHARRIGGVKRVLFSNHAPLGQTTLRVGSVSA